MRTRDVFWIFLVVFFVVTSIYLYMLFSASSEAVSVCGNGMCEKNENCLDCTEDCSCKNGAYCSAQGRCLQTECGDGDCGPGENSGNCCSDCSCMENGSICNTDNQLCEFPGTEISDETVRQSIVAYYEAKGEVIARIEISGSTMNNDQLVKSAFVYIEGEEYERTVLINESGDVVEELFRW